MDEQQQSARAGGQAVGGNAPRPEDPSDPKRAAKRAERVDRAMRDSGFGDHKGTDIGESGTEEA